MSVRLRILATLVAVTGLLAAAAAPASAQPGAITIIAESSTPVGDAEVLACEARYTIVAQWPGGFAADVVVTNTGTLPIQTWTVTISYPNGSSVTQVWGAVATHLLPNTIVVSPPTWAAGVLLPNQSFQFGMVGTGDGIPLSVAVSCLT